MCEDCERAFHEAWRLHSERMAEGGRNVAQVIFEEECAKRGLDLAAVPPKAGLLITALNLDISRVTVGLIHDPGTIMWLAAALSGMARGMDLYAEARTTALAAEVFGPDGPTPPDGRPGERHE